MVACQQTDCVQDTLNDYYVQGPQWWTSPVHNRYATSQEVEMSVTTNKYVTVQPFLTLKMHHLQGLEWLILLVGTVACPRFVSVIHRWHLPKLIIL